MRELLPYLDRLAVYYFFLDIVESVGKSAALVVNDNECYFLRAVIYSK